MAGEPLDRLEIQISSSSTDAAKKVEDLAAALDKLKKSARGVSEKSSKNDIQKIGKDADKGVRISKKTVEEMEALARATSSINGNAGDSLKSLAEGLKSLSAVKEIKIPKNLADNIVNLNAAIDLVDDRLADKASKFTSALGALAGAERVNISSKLPDRMLDIGAAMELISDESIHRLDSLTASLQRLSGVDLKGLPGAIRQVAKGDAGSASTRIENDIRKAEMQSVKSAGELEKAKKQLADLSGTGLDTEEISDATASFGKYRDAIADADSQLETLKSSLAGIGGDLSGGSSEVLARIRDTIKEVQDAQFQAKKAGELAKNALQRAKFSVADKVKESSQEVDVAKLDASIEKAKASIEDLTERYEVLQRVQGKGSQDTQTRNAAELAKVSALLEEQERLYDSLIEKKKKYASTGASGDAKQHGISVDQVTAVDKVTQRVGLLQRALAWVRNAWSLTNAEALKATSEGTAALERMKKSLFDNATAWSKIKSVASNAFDGVKESIAAAAEQSKGLAKFLSVGVPVIGTIASLLRGIVGIFGKLVSGALQLARTLAGAALNGVKKLASGLKTIGGYVFKYVTNPFRRVISTIDKLKSKIISVLYYRAIRSAIKMITDGFKEGIENLYYFSSLTESQFKPAMDSLASSSLYLKNSLGAMAAPLIQAVAPAVNYLIDLFVSLLNVINMVFSVLGGRTYTKALKTSAKYADDLDKSLGGGASSAKELQRYLIGIDQLTIMPDEPNRGGGGGGGSDLGAKYEEMFEQVPIPDWALNVKNAINAGKWKDAGKLLAKKINEGIIEPLKKNAHSWGNKIGQAIQNGIELGLGFIRDLDIEGFAASLTTIVGNAMNKIKPRDLGAIIANKIKSAFRFVHGLLEGYTGPDIGAYLAEVVNGWFAELRRDKGWKKAGHDLNNIILGIINGVTNFLKNLNTDGIAKDLKDFFGEIEWDDIWASLERLAETAANKVPWENILNGLWRFAANALVFLRRNVLNIPDSQASQIWKSLQTKLSNSSATINWADIISGLIAFVTDMTSTIKNAIPSGGWEEIWESVKSGLATALGFNGDWESMKSEFQEKVVTTLSSAIDTAIEMMYQSIKDKHPVIASALSLMFPTDVVNSYSAELKSAVANGGRQAGEALITELLQRRQITYNTAQELMNNLSSGIYDNVSSVRDATNGVVKEVDSVLNGAGFGGKAGGGAGRKVSINLDATKTQQYETTTNQLRDIKDKSATLKAIAMNPYEDSMRFIQKTFSETNDKTATLTTNVKSANSAAMETVQNVWETVEDKTVTLRATVKDANPKALESIKSAWNSISDKTATLNAKVVDAMSSTRTKMLEAWQKLTTKTATLTARATNASSSTFTNLLSTWSSLTTKSVTVTAYGSVASSVYNAQNQFNSLYNRSATVTVYGSIASSFYEAKKAFDSIYSKTVIITVKNNPYGNAGGGIFTGGQWRPIQGYAAGGNPKRARLFYANENGIPELIGRIGSNTAVMNNGQIVASVASGVYRAVSAAMVGLGSYFANIATGISRIPEVLSNITPVQPQPIMVGASSPSYEMDMSVFNRPKYDASGSSQEDKEEMINAINAAAQRIITAIAENGGDLIVDGDRLGTKTTSVQNRQTRMYGKSVLYT